MGHEKVKRHRVDFTQIKLVLVPAEEMEPNPQNPYFHLTPEERHARFIEILAQLYREMKATEGNGSLK